MSNRPNILLITSDQQHFNALGYRNPKLKTPNLDRLAREGTDFSRAYCPNPTCTPTRASIITGQYPSTHGAWSLGTTLSEDATTVGDIFQAVGYATTLVGKAHFQALASAPGWPSIESQPTLRDLDFWNNFRGPWYGFRFLETARMHADEAHAGGHYGVWMEEKGLKNWRDYYQHYPRRADEKHRRYKWDLPAEFHYTTWTAEKSIDYMNQHLTQNEPFFLWSSFADPHPPYLVPEPWDTMYDPADMDVAEFRPGEFDDKPPHFAKTQEEKPDFSQWAGQFANHGFSSHLQSDEMKRKNMAVYYGMTSFMDEQIGRILDHLDATGQAENTLVVFTTDHGHFLGEHGLVAKGAFHYEDMLKLPFIVRWPGKVPAGRTCDAIQSLVDLAPTFLEAADIEVPGIMQGVSQLGVWTGQEASARDFAICENRHQTTKLDLRTFITDRYKLTVYRNEDFGELFDLQEDPGEFVNHWDNPAYASVKLDLLHKFVQAEMQRAYTPMERIAGA